MTTVDCRFGMLPGTSHLMPDWVRGDRRWIGEQYANASGNKVQITTSQLVELNDPRIGSGPYVPLQLQWALTALTMNPPNGGTPRAVPNIAVLFADTFGFPQWQDLFGLMFDPGVQAGLGDPMIGRAAPEFENSPREGCVVFLDAIRRQRVRPGMTVDDAKADYEWETSFTTMHELGHVFNLWHIETAPNFLSSSARLNILPTVPQRNDFKQFDPRHGQFMADAHDFVVSPGGAPFGTRGDGFPVGGETHNGAFPTRVGRDLQLELSISDDEFFAFEPVELDLRVSTKSGAKYSVVSMFDPGYDCFDVWVEEPDGERRRYRSMFQYCGNTAKVTLPFSRDIALLLESGRRFFRKAGKHKLWVSLQVSKTRFITSKPVTCKVRDPYVDRKDFEKLLPFLGKPAASSLIYHKYATPRSKSVSNLHSWVKDKSRERRTAPVASSLGAMYSTYYDQHADKKMAALYRDEACRLLETALRRKVTGIRRAEKTEKLLDGLSRR